MFHINDIKLFNRCPQSYINNKKERKNFFNYFKNVYDMKDVYKELFHFDNCFIGKTGDDTTSVIKSLNDYSYFINPRFGYEDLRVKASLLIKNDDSSFNLYFVKPTIHNDIDLESFYITYDVLCRNGLTISNIFIIHFNPNYVYHNHINFAEAIIISDSIGDTKLVDLIKNINFNYLDILNRLRITNSYNIHLNKTCTSCEYMNICHKDISDNSVLHLVSSQYKFDMYENGCLYLKDVPTKFIDGTSLQYAQIMADRNNGVYIDKFRLRSFLDAFKAPSITFIDFEWDSYLLPCYEGMKCLSTLPFEFSLYTLNSDRSTYEYTYVGKDDCREEFIETLINKIPKEGPIVAFNSFSAEVLRLKELSEQFAKYKNILNNLCKRFIDIAEVFSNGYFYDLRFKGQLSLKNILSSISNIDYQALNVHNGLDAIYYYRKYVMYNDDSLKNDLISYCRQDASGLVILYKYLLDLL